MSYIGGEFVKPSSKVSAYVLVISQCGEFQLQVYRVSMRVQFVLGKVTFAGNCILAIRSPTGELLVFFLRSSFRPFFGKPEAHFTEIIYVTRP